MANQMHKRFDDDFVKAIFQKYLSKHFSVKQVLALLQIKRSRFFVLLDQFKKDPDNFSISYKRKSPGRITSKLEKIILNELETDKQLIKNKNVPLYGYNYSYIKRRIEKKHKLAVSIPTIINRAKKYDCYIKKRAKKRHDREILTNYPGELIQHDSSLHLFAPSTDIKWHLISSIDDYSRYILYAKLIENESSWDHISALESVISRFGIPLRYYTDSHRIFRFVQGRDSVWRNHRKTTDQAMPQWKMVLDDLNIDTTYALSPQAKGKVERPYRWMQDTLVRTCARENITKIDQAQKILKEEVDRYNNKQVHSTTNEIPYIRFNHAVSLGNTMFREYTIPKPYKSPKDIFCLRMRRILNGYRKVSIDKQDLRIKGVPTYEKVEIRIVPDIEKDVSELRFWYRGKLVDTHFMKGLDLKRVQFLI